MTTPIINTENTQNVHISLSVNNNRQTHSTTVPIAANDCETNTQNTEIAKLESQIAMLRANISKGKRTTIKKYKKPYKNIIKKKLMI